MVANKEFLLDINSVEVTHDGVNGFYWPILPREINEFSTRLIRAIITIVRQAQKKHVYGVNESIILSVYFAQEAAMAYQAYLLIARAAHDGYEIKTSTRNRLVTAFLHQEKPGPSVIMRQLRRGPAPLKKWRTPLRFIRDIIVGRQQGMTRRKLWPINEGEKIISMTIDPISLIMAKKSQQQIIYKRPNHWFKRPPSEISNNKNYNEIVEQIMRITVKNFSQADVQIPDFVKSYLTAWLTEAMTLVGWYLNQLSKNERKIPLNLWTNTAGYVWARILSRCVREKGGKITRHTHAGGGGYFHDSWAQGVLEFEDCDTFVAFSDNQITAYQRAFTGNDIVQNDLPRFVSLNTNAKPVKAIKPRKNKSKTIMYASTVYPGEFIYQAANGLMSDVVLLDWETRLIAQLQKYGYQVLLKPHPVDGLCIAPPASINRLFGPVVIHDLFENVIAQADVIIMDAPISSVFFTAIRAGCPFVYIDFDIASFSPEAYELLARRCPIVKGWYDSANRACIDWDALLHAIEICDQYNDQSFTQNYLNH